MITQVELIKEFFVKNANRDVPHNEVVPWLMSEYKKEQTRFLPILIEV